MNETLQGVYLAAMFQRASEIESEQENIELREGNEQAEADEKFAQEEVVQRTCYTNVNSLHSFKTEY
jgi:hypothetical protein